MSCRFFVVSVFWLMAACIEPFTPDITQEQTHLLVVDGYVNIGPGETSIKLSLVRTLDEGVSNEGLGDAQVEIIDDQKVHYQLPSTTNGVYSAELNLSEIRTYQLSILLPNGKHYESTVLTPKLTPEIDSLWWSVTDQVNIHVASHDDTGSSKYYLWTFKENWQYRAQYPALYGWSNDTLQLLSSEERKEMRNCYKSFVSTRYQLGSSAAFTSDQVTKVLKNIPFSAERTSVKYAITVTQRTLTQDEYNYQELMNKNTEAVGSFADPMPSQLYGNIYCTTNSGELAVGYIGAYSTKRARLFILNDELPPAPTQEHCLTEIVLWEDKALLNEKIGHFLPTGMFLSGGNFYVSLMQKACLDCRTRDSEPRPDFWGD